MTEVHTDGNGVAGMLSEVLAVEVTTMQRRCQSCGAENALGAHRAYQGAGIVLRCPACDDVAVRIGVREDALVFEWRGTYTAPRPA
jgi:Zn finger protein HypA/HybF involved in hydrogenase expression